MIAMPVVNWMAVVLAGIAQMVVGFIWYSPAVFGKTWSKLSGLKQKSNGMPLMPMVWMFVGTLVLAFVLSGFVGYAGAKGFVQGAEIGAMAWLGFVATTTIAMVLFEDKPLKLYLLHNGHYLIGMVLAGAILGHLM